MSRLVCCVAVIVLLTTFAGDLQAQDPTGRFSGIVAENGGLKPVARVRISLDLEPADGTPEFKTLTAFTGAFVLPDLPPGTYKVALRHPAYGPLDDTVTVVDGETLNKNYLLNPLHTHFSLYMQVKDVVTNVWLPGATVTLRYWPSESAGDNLKVETVLTTGLDGLAVFDGQKSGWYQLQVTRPHWNGYTWPTTGKSVYIEKSQSGLAALLPKKTELNVSVVGIDPVKWSPTDPASQKPFPLGDVIVEVTNVEYGDPTLLQLRELTPTRSAFTVGLTSPAVAFDNIVPTQLKVEVKKLGYDAQTVYISPNNLSGTFAGLEVTDFKLHTETMISVNLDSLYKLQKILEGAVVKLRGLNGTHTAKIARETTSTLSGNKVIARFDHLLPGRYWIQVSHNSATDLGSTNTEIGPPILNVTFNTVTTIVEVADKENRQVNIELRPIPAVVRGQVLAHDRLIRPFSTSELNDRVLSPKSTLLEISVHENVDLFKDEKLKTHSITTDQQGRFRVVLLPGRYGFRLPNLTDYDGYRVLLSTQKPGQPLSDSVVTEWPYTRSWKHGGWLHFESQNNYVADIYVHKHFVNLSKLMLVDRGTDKFVVPSAKLLILKENDQFHTRDFRELLLGGSVSMSGPKSFTGPLATQLATGPVAGLYVEELKDGLYTATATHPHFTVPELTFRVGKWGTPGQVPPTPWYEYPTVDDKGKAVYYIPGLNHTIWSQPHSWYATYTPATTPFKTMQFRVCRVDTDAGPGKPEYEDPADANVPKLNLIMPGGPLFFAYINQQDKRFEGMLFSMFEVNDVIYAPTGDFNIFYFDPTLKKWFKRTKTDFEAERLCCNKNQTNCSNQPDPTSHTVYWLYVDGSLQTPGEIPTMLRSKIDVEIRTYDRKTHKEISGLNVTFKGQTVASGKGSFVSDVADFSWKKEDLVVENGKWKVASDNDLKRVILKPYVETQAEKVQVTLRIELSPAMLVTGKIVDKTGKGIEGAKVTIRSRYGNELASLTSGPAGAYSKGGLEIAAVYVEARAAGFLPNRKRFAAPAGDTDSRVTTADLTLDPIPPPDVTAFSFDRYGLFIPGIVKTNDATGFSALTSVGDLTTTFTLSVTSQQLTVKLPAFDGVDGNPGGPTDVLIEDEVSQVWVVDKRAFKKPSFNDDPNDSADDPEMMKLPSPLNYQTVTAWLHWIASAEKFSLPYFVKHVRASTTDSKTYSGSFKLWRMPVGDFVPYAVILTKLGAVKVVDYEAFHPSGENKLKGVVLPRWASFMANLMGSMSNVPNVDVTRMIPVGKFIPMPTFIGLVALLQGKYLRYEYSLKVSWLEGMKNSANGLLSTGGRLFGVTLAANFGFIASGQTNTVNIIGKADVSKNVTDRLLRDHGLDKPAAVLKGKKPLITPTVKLSGTGGLSVIQSYGTNPFPDWRVKAFVNAGLEVEVKLDLTPVLSKLPYIGPVLKAAKETGLVEFFGIANFGLGGMFSTEFDTIYPKLKFEPGYAVQPQPSPRLHLFGGMNELLPVNLDQVFWKAGLGLELSIANGRGTGRGVIQLAAPSNEAPPLGGVRMVINKKSEWPLITRVRGAASIAATVRINLWLLSLSKTWQWDIARFDWQLTSEAYLQMVDNHETTMLITPQNAPQSTFVNKEGELIGSFFPAGSISTTANNGGGMLYTDSVPGSGKMPLKFSRPGPEGWSDPVTISDTNGALSIGLVGLPGGGLIAVWSEVDPDSDALSPKTTLKYATSTDGGTSWSQPKEIASLDGTAHGLKLVLTGDQIVLAWLLNNEGPQSNNQAVQVAVFEADKWSAPHQLQAQTGVTGLALAGSRSTSAPEASLGVMHASGTLLVYRWDGSSWSDAVTVAPDAKGGFDLDYDDEGTLWLATAVSGAIRLYKRPDGAALFEEVGPGIADVVAGEVRLSASNGEQKSGLVLAWVESIGEDVIMTVQLNSDGAKIAEPQSVSAGGDGSLSKLQLIRGQDGSSTRIVAHSEDDDGSTVREWTLDTGPISPEQVEPFADLLSPDDAQQSDSFSDSGGNSVGGGGGCGIVQSTEAPTALLLAVLVFFALLRRRRPTG